MSRIAFGTRGAQIPALIRGGVAIAWFGIQTYLASVVLRIMIIALVRPPRPSTRTASWGCRRSAGSRSSRCGWSR